MGVGQDTLVFSSSVFIAHAPCRMTVLDMRRGTQRKAQLLARYGADLAPAAPPPLCITILLSLIDRRGTVADPGIEGPNGPPCSNLMRAGESRATARMRTPTRDVQDAATHQA